MLIDGDRGGWIEPCIVIIDQIFYMQAWRAVFPGPMEMDVYEDVTDGG